MPHRLNHDELYRAYLELQSRVTQFSAKEQELINVRDQLDQELLVYRRMNAFHAAAIDIHNLEDLLRLVAESVVDLFETELGYAVLMSRSTSNKRCEHLECPSTSMSSSLKEDLLRLSLDSEKDQTVLRSEDAHMPSSLGRFVMTRKERTSSDVVLVVLGGVTRDRRETFRDFNEKTRTLFSLFVKSASAYLENVLAEMRIQEQLKTIRESELELRRLSLIATHTDSGVIITDATGRIEWVNEAFVQNTGYSPDEIIGKKPKEFLQEPGLNEPGILEQLSEALEAKRNISLTLKNRKKQGDLFYVRLNITPVFDLEQRPMNFIAIQQDITSEKLHEERIMQKNEELVKINKELDQFVYSTSHDLRSPLLSIRGLLDLLGVDQWDLPEREYLEMISESVNRLDHTILDILNYSRNARLDIQPVKFNLRSLVDATLQDLSSLHPSTRLEVSWQGSEEVLLDEIRVSILLKNVCSNAVKYGRNAGDQAFVKVHVDTRSERCQIKVTDNGEGIAEEHQTKVFDMFFRATTSSTGTGLGLYIVKEIVDKLNGFVTLTSVQGQGTEVILDLPQHR